MCRGDIAESYHSFNWKPLVPCRVKQFNFLGSVLAGINEIEKVVASELGLDHAHGTYTVISYEVETCKPLKKTEERKLIVLENPTVIVWISGRVGD